MMDEAIGLLSLEVIDETFFSRGSAPQIAESKQWFRRSFDSNDGQDISEESSTSTSGEPEKDFKLHSQFNKLHKEINHEIYVQMFIICCFMFYNLHRMWFREVASEEVSTSMVLFPLLFFLVVFLSSIVILVEIKKLQIAGYLKLYKRLSQFWNIPLYLHCISFALVVTLFICASESSKFPLLATFDEHRTENFLLFLWTSVHTLQFICWIIFTRLIWQHNTFKLPPDVYQMVSGSNFVKELHADTHKCFVTQVIQLLEKQVDAAEIEVRKLKQERKDLNEKEEYRLQEKVRLKEKELSNLEREKRNLKAEIERLQESTLKNREVLLREVRQAKSANEKTVFKADEKLDILSEEVRQLEKDNLGLLILRQVEQQEVQNLLCSIHAQGQMMFGSAINSSLVDLESSFIGPDEMLSSPNLSTVLQYESEREPDNFSSLHTRKDNLRRSTFDSYTCLENVNNSPNEFSDVLLEERSNMDVTYSEVDLLEDHQFMVDEFDTSLQSDDDSYSEIILLNKR